MSDDYDPDRCQIRREGKRCTGLRFHDSSINATPHTFTSTEEARVAVQALLTDARAALREHARTKCPDVSEDYVMAIAEALDMISLDEAITALDLDQKEHAK